MCLEGITIFNPKQLVPANAGEAPMHPKDTAMTNCFKSEFMFIS
jgi:hypothetical protein